MKPSPHLQRIPHDQDATKDISLPITFGTQDGYEAFRKKVREDEKFIKLNSESVSDWWLVKFFDGARGNGELALKMLEKTLQWRLDYSYSTLCTEDFSDHHSTGKLYFHHTARDATPILIWRIARHRADPKTSDHTVRFIVSMMDRGIRVGTITSRITLLVDRTDSTNDNVEGIHFFRSLTSILQTHFPEMLQRIIIFPTNWLLWTVWKVVKPFLDVTVVEKVLLMGPKEYKETLLEHIPHEHLPVRYGGTSYDWTDTVPHTAHNSETSSLHDSAVSVSAVSGPLSLGKKGVERSSSWAVGSKVKRMWGGSKDSASASGVEIGGGKDKKDTN